MSRSMSRSFKVVGHRGLPQCFPENSLAGLRAALEAGVDGVELDVQVSADGHCVILHDEALLRTTGVQGSVHQFTLDQLRALSIGEAQRFGDKFVSETLPALTDLSELCALFPKAEFFVELKAEPLAFLSHEVYLEKALADLKHCPRCHIISYDFSLVKIAREKFQQKIGWVLSYYDEASQLLAEDLQPDFLICNARKLPELELWQGAWQWFIYDIVDKSKAEALAQRGVAYIESWDPPAIL